MANLILRKLWRINGVIFPLIYILSDSKKFTLLCSLYVLVFFLFIELARFLNSSFNTWLFKRFRFILKEEERKHLLNTSFFLIFLTVAIWLFRKEVVIYSVFFVIFGDISASIFGRYFGHIKFRHKTLEGSFAFFITCILCGYLLNAVTAVKLPMRVVLVAGLFSSLAELFSVIDDNLSVGLTCGIVMEIALRIL